MLEGNGHEFANSPPIGIGGATGVPVGGGESLEALQPPRGVDSSVELGTLGSLGPSLLDATLFSDLRPSTWRERRLDSEQDSGDVTSDIVGAEVENTGYDPRATLPDLSQDSGPEDLRTAHSQQIGLLHRIARGTLHALNDFAVFTSEQLFTSNPIGRLVCASSAAMGWMVPPEVYRAHPSLALVVATGALVSAIAASAVNRAIAYEPDLMQDPIIAKEIERSDQANFRESLCIAGIVMGPASFWAGVSPLLTHVREAAVQSLQGSSVSNWISDGLNYAAGRVEHMVPFMLIGMLTTMRLVNKNPERFVQSMSRMASLLHRSFGGIAHVRESLSRELRDE